MKNFIKPDWENSILNVSGTFAEFLGAENKNKTLSVIKNELNKNYKNLAFICCDGLGGILMFRDMLNFIKIKN